MAGGLVDFYAATPWSWPDAVTSTLWTRSTRPRATGATCPAGRAALGEMFGGDVEVGSAGAWVRTGAGRELLNCGGYGVFITGARHPRVVAAVREQLDRNPVATRLLLEPQAALAAEALASVTPPGLDRVHFACGGAEAVEAAIKLARANGKRHLVSMVDGYHGKTLGALSATAKPVFQRPFRPLLPDVSHVPYGDAGRPGRACWPALPGPGVRDRRAGAGRGGRGRPAGGLPARGRGAVPGARRVPRARRDPDRPRPARALVGRGPRGRRAGRAAGRQGARRRRRAGVGDGGDRGGVRAVRPGPVHPHVDVLRRAAGHGGRAGRDRGDPRGRPGGPRRTGSARGCSASCAGCAPTCSATRWPRCAAPAC